MTILILLVVIGAVAFRVTSAEDRARFIALAIALARNLREAATRTRPEGDAFRAALRERTPRALVTLAFAVLMGAAAITGARLETWGNAGLNTTNGEWWRLATSTFVHAGFFQAAIDVIVLVQLGFVLERMVGRGAFAATFIASGVFANLVHLSKRPLDIGAGASAAVFGLYGLLAAVLLWGLRQKTEISIPRPTLNTMGVWAGLFTLVSLINGSLSFSAEMTGLAIGAIAGAVLARSSSESVAPPQHVMITAGACAVFAFAFAVPLRGISDVRPEIHRVVAIEQQTTGIYEAASEKFRKGRMTADALAQVIDKMIVPELIAADARLKTYKKVPTEHQPLVSDAAEYLRLRSEAWRLRATAVRRTSIVPRRDAERSTSDERWRLNAEARHRANLVTLGNAESSERTSLVALQKVNSDIRELK